MLIYRWQNPLVGFGANCKVPPGPAPRDEKGAMAKIQIGLEKTDYIYLRNRPTPSLMNVLLILGEYPNRVVGDSEICERLGIARHAVTNYVTRLRRQYITEDWVIESVYTSGCRENRYVWGYRLIDLRDR